MPDSYLLAYGWDSFYIVDNPWERLEAVPEPLRGLCVPHVMQGKEISVSGQTPARYDDAIASEAACKRSRHTQEERET
jgi:hypothetical protein